MDSQLNVTGSLMTKENTKGKGTQSLLCLSIYWKDQSSDIPCPQDQWACLKQKMT